MKNFKRGSAFGAAVAIAVTTFSATPAFAVKVDYEADAKAAAVEYRNIHLSIEEATGQVKTAENNLAEAKKKLKAAQKKFIQAMRKKDDTTREQAEVDKQWAAKEAASESLSAAQKRVKELFASLDKSQKKLEKAIEAARNVKNATEGLSASLHDPARSESFAEKMLRYKNNSHVRDVTGGLTEFLKNDSALKSEPNTNSSEDPSKKADPSQGPSKKADPSQGPSKKADPSQGPSKKADPSQGPSKKADPNQDPSKKADPSQGPSKKIDPNQDPSKKVAPKMENKSGLPLTGAAAGTFAGMSVILVAGGAALALRRKNA
ncbi:hypothetical protein [Arcanobacterium canis]